MIERIARHYRGRWRQGYVRGKLLNDPAYGAAFELLKDSPLPVLDVGCGIGLLEFYFRERGFGAPMLGLDFDAGKIAEAQKIADRCYRDLRFSARDVTQGQDLREFAAGLRGHVVVFDLLHYLPAEAQRPLLETVAANVAPGGLCLIRATPRDESWRFRATQIEEFFLRASLWMKSGAIAYATADEILAPFRARRFSSEVRPLWGRTPFNSHLFILRAPRIE